MKNPHKKRIVLCPKPTQISEVLPIWYQITFGQSLPEVKENEKD